VRLDDEAPDGFLIHSHAGDDWRECRDYIRSRLGLSTWQPGEDERRHVDRRRADDAALKSRDNHARIARAREMWDAGRDPRGTLAERYLESRALTLTDDLAGRVLRFHPRCPWRNEATGRTTYVPALIAAFRTFVSDDVAAVHRIALISHAGGKLGRRMLGVVAGAAVKLAPITDATLAIGEGVETCMAAQQLGYGPAWALGSAGAIERLPVLPGIERLILLAENDDSGTSKRATDRCGDRWMRAGRRVTRVWPDQGCGDLNDELIARRP
jgi:putative DNA primase/helicase